MKKKPTKKRGGWRPGSGRPKAGRTLARDGSATLLRFYPEERELMEEAAQYMGCLLYTSDAADE